MKNPLLHILLILHVCSCLKERSSKCESSRYRISPTQRSLIMKRLLSFQFCPFLIWSDLTTRNAQVPPPAGWLVGLPIVFYWEPVINHTWINHSELAPVCLLVNAWTVEEFPADLVPQGKLKWSPSYQPIIIPRSLSNLSIVLSSDLSALEPVASLMLQLADRRWDEIVPTSRILNFQLHFWHWMIVHTPLLNATQVSLNNNWNKLGEDIFLAFEGVCSFRLDFGTFTLRGPPDLTEADGGQCSADSLTVQDLASSSFIPVICGENAGQHSE